LGRLKIQESLPVLKDMVDDPDKQIQKVAVTALGEMGGEDVHPSSCSPAPKWAKCGYF
jgi:HEAT repeat protein